MIEARILERDEFSTLCSTREINPRNLRSQRVSVDLTRYLNDSRFAIDNGEAERAIRPLAVGRPNWLQVDGDGGLKTASVLPSVCASATRHHLKTWSNLRDVLDQLAARSATANVYDLPPDAWANRQHSAL